MRIGNISGVLGGPEVHKFFHHIMDQIRFDSGDEFSVGEKSRSTFAITNVGLFIEFTIAPEFRDSHHSFLGLIASFNDNRWNPMLCQTYGTEKSSRPRTNDDGRRFKRRKLGQ